jgi:hypothetical protein
MDDKDSEPDTDDRHRLSAPRNLDFRNRIRWLIGETVLTYWERTVIFQEDEAALAAVAYWLSRYLKDPDIDAIKARYHWDISVKQHGNGTPDKHPIGTPFGCWFRLVPVANGRAPRGAE